MPEFIYPFLCYPLKGDGYSNFTVKCGCTHYAYFRSPYENDALAVASVFMSCFQLRHWSVE